MSVTNVLIIEYVQLLLCKLLFTYFK